MHKMLLVNNYPFSSLDLSIHKFKVMNHFFLTTFLSIQTSSYRIITQSLLSQPLINYIFKQKFRSFTFIGNKLNSIKLIVCLPFPPLHLRAFEVLIKWFLSSLRHGQGGRCLWVYTMGSRLSCLLRKWWQWTCVRKRRCFVFFQNLSSL